MKASLDARHVVAALVVIGLLVLPIYTSLSGNGFALTLFTRIVIFALAAASLNLIMGYGGMMSFGHAAYLGIGGYAVGILAAEGIGSGFIQWPVALLASALFALVIGALSLRTRGAGSRPRRASCIAAGPRPRWENSGWNSPARVPEKAPGMTHQANDCRVSRKREKYPAVLRGESDDPQAFLGGVRLPRPAPPGAFLLGAARAAGHQSQR